MKRLKIGILTYHNAINYGAALQTIALYTYLEKEYSNDATFEIIDYRNEKIEKKNSPGMILKSNISLDKKIKRIIGLFQVYKKKMRFKEFLRDISYSHYYSAEEMKNIENAYDAFIIGSDQLWNFSLNDGDANYLLPYIANKNKIITYGTSIGAEDIDEMYKDVFCDSIKSYGKLAVRENDAVQLIKDLVDIDATLVSDPVMLVDIAMWNKYVKPDTKEYVTQYLFYKNNIPIMQEMMRNSGMNNMIVKKIAGGVKVKDYFDQSVEVCISSGPKEFLNYIFNGQYIFTDSFHCTAMAILFHKPFTVFLSGNRGSDSRIMNLLAKVGLESRAYSGEKKCNDDIDWETVDKRITSFKNESREYLKSALKYLESI